MANSSASRDRPDAKDETASGCERAHQICKPGSSPCFGLAGRLFAPVAFACHCRARSPPGTALRTVLAARCPTTVKLVCAGCIGTAMPSAPRLAWLVTPDKASPSPHFRNSAGRCRWPSRPMVLAYAYTDLARFIPARVQTAASPISPAGARRSTGFPEVRSLGGAGRRC